MSASRLPILLLCAALGTGTVAPARAAWPTSPSAPLAAGNGMGSQSDAVAVAASGGGCYVAWVEDGAVRVRLLTPAGETAAGWPEAGIRAGESVAPQSRPVAIEDGAGGILIAWEQGPTAASRDIYAQHLLPDGTIGPGGWASTGVAVCLAPGQQSRPKLVHDRGGGMLCVWMDERAGNGSVSLYGARLSHVGYPGTNWPGPGKAVAGVRSPSDPFALAPDASDGFYAAFIAPDSTLHVQRMNGSAEVPPGWAPLEGIVVGAGKPAPLPLAAAPDPSGGAYVAWSSAEDAGNVRVLRIASAGGPSPGWPAAGILVCGAAGMQSIGGAIADGLGGVIVGWEDHRAEGPNHGDIYAQRLLRSGEIAPGWTPNGVALETTARDARMPSIVTDGVGGAILVYPASDAGSPADLRGSRVMSGGSRANGWPAAGTQLTSSAAAEPAPALARDVRGGAYLAWSAGAPPRAWLARLDAGGALGGPFVTDAPGTPASGAIALGIPSPTPSRGSVSLTLTIPAEASVRVTIHDVSGRRIREPLVALLTAGAHRLAWDGRDEAGDAVPSGLYFLTVEAAGMRATRRVLLAR